MVLKLACRPAGRQWDDAESTGREMDPAQKPARLEDSDTSAGQSELDFHEVQGAQGDNKSSQTSRTHPSHTRSCNKPARRTPRTGFLKHSGAAAYGPKAAFWANPCMPDTILESVKPEATSGLLMRLGQHFTPPRAGHTWVRANTRSSSHLGLGDTVCLNPRCSLGTIHNKLNHSSQRPPRDGQAQPQFPEAFPRDEHSTALCHPGSLF